MLAVRIVRLALRDVRPRVLVVSVAAVVALILAAVGLVADSSSYASGSQATITSPASPAGPYTNGQSITVSGTGFSTRASGNTIQILECSDVDGQSDDLPVDNSTCDGTTVNPNTIVPNAGGGFSSSYAVEALSTSGPNPSPINCDATDYCVLWVGEDYVNNFTGTAAQPVAFSPPFLMDTSGGGTTTTTTSSTTSTTMTTSSTSTTTPSTTTTTHPTTTTTTTTTSTPPTTTTPSTTSTTTPTTTTSTPPTTTSTSTTSTTTSTTSTTSTSTTSTSTSTTSTSTSTSTTSTSTSTTSTSTTTPGAVTTTAPPTSSGGGTNPSTDASSGELAFTGAGPLLPLLALLGGVMALGGAWVRRRLGRYAGARSGSE